MQSGWRKYGKRFAAPAAFLLAVTIAVVLVRAGLETNAASDTTTTTVLTKPVKRKSVPARHRRYYRLKAGQTLSDVALRFQTTVEQLLALNPGVSPTNLTVNQRIRVK